MEVHKKIAVIGTGNLGNAIVEGMIESQKFSADNIIATRRQTHLIDSLQQKGVHTTSDNCQAVRESHIVILAVQPKQLEQILHEIADDLHEDHIIVSVITGVAIEQIGRLLSKPIAIVRAMPNTAIAIKQSMTCIAHRNVSPDSLSEVQSIFDTLGKTLIIDEELMAAATVLGACGIAFFMRFIRAASQGGIEVGFHAEEAQLIAAQTAKGAASLLLAHHTHPEQEIDKVTTPQGCTIAGLNEMEHNGLSSALIKGVKASFNRIADIT
ncbi:pyrroline-5-carboxylate reductase [Candidatus Uabimicrobium amorphum]|uniref:Pyrroline-5-carboxylate reductase n=1 Tax=Uabimicrobium amorphum TaxID=2596890 RepID=A0A5S9IMD2_UABAM|nr:pyrroline-5-carboxylate reductase [Candidatus Uabimicrobium amorphum]BBM84177.1 pyrroline-5-carboxylate reductase [Candidatus Uabimicrobium amorphum]